MCSPTLIGLSKCRWPLPTTTWSLSSTDARTDGPGSWSLCPHGRSHSDRPGSSRSSHHCDRSAGWNVSDFTSADCVSALSAGYRHPHLPRHRPHEHTLLPLLLLCRVSRSWKRHLVVGFRCFYTWVMPKSESSFKYTELELDDKLCQENLQESYIWQYKTVIITEYWLLLYCCISIELIYLMRHFLIQSFTLLTLDALSSLGSVLES